MNQELIELYSDYLLSSFGKTTATSLSELLDNQYSHDQITRLLSTVLSQYHGHFHAAIAP